MNCVPCLTWVAKGIAKSVPDQIKLSPEEMKNLFDETKDMSRALKDEEDISDEDNISDVEDNDEKEENLIQNSDNDVCDEEKDDDFESRYNLQSYDDDGEDEPFMKISDVATFIDNKEDNYIVNDEEVEEDDKEDEDDFIIKDTDNLLLVGHIEDQSSVLEVYVFNKEEDSLYVHHEIVLPAYPMALEWLDFHPSDETPGNYVAVADMTPVIKIWDLDVVDLIEPEYCLGKEAKQKGTKKISLKYHTDAVLSLSWNKHVRNILASGSADSSIIIWDLQEVKPLQKLDYHTNKVQSLQWHPFESSFLLSGCTDGLLKLYDCRAPDTECKSWKVEGEIERVVWNMLDPIKFLCSTDNGFVHSIDMKNDKIEQSIKAHSDAVTGLDICPEQPHIFVTASMDKTIKVWDLKSKSHLHTQKLKVGSIYISKFSPDSGLTTAIGGNCKSNSLKIMDLEKILNVSEKDTDPSITKPNTENKQKKIFSTGLLITPAKKFKAKRVDQKFSDQSTKELKEIKTHSDMPPTKKLKKEKCKTVHK